mgnify:CR=1 FL=1
MKSDSRNEFWHSVKIEKGNAALQTFKFYREGECHINVCSRDEKNILIRFGDRLTSTNFFSTELPVSEAREFANIILRVADAIDNKTRS